MTYDDRRSSPLWIGRSPCGGRADIQVAWAGFAQITKAHARTPTNIDCYLVLEGEGSIRFDEGPAQAIVPGCWFVTRPGIAVVMAHMLAANGPNTDCAARSGHTDSLIGAGYHMAIQSMFFHGQTR